MLTVAAAPSCGRDRADREIVQLVVNRQHKSFHPDCFAYSSIVNAYCDSLTRINLDRPQYFQCVISFSFIITLFISLSQGSAESTAGVERCSLTSIQRWGVARCGLARLKSREQQVILMTRHQLHAPLRLLLLVLYCRLFLSSVMRHFVLPSSGEYSTSGRQLRATTWTQGRSKELGRSENPCFGVLDESLWWQLVCHNNRVCKSLPPSFQFKCKKFSIKLSLTVSLKFCLI